MRIGIREYEDAVAADDSALFASRVSRQARVPHRIHIPGADLLTHCEASLGVRLRSHKVSARPGRGGKGGGGKRRSCLLRSRRGLAGLHLLPRDQAKLHQELQVAGQPPLVIAHLQITRGGKKLDTVTPGVDIPLAPRIHRAVHGIHTAFPRLVKYGFVLFVLDWTHIVYAAHVVDSVHGLPPAGGATLATPIMESRVTRAASSSSVIFSVPAGLSGKTR